MIKSVFDSFHPQKSFDNLFNVALKVVNLSLVPLRFLTPISIKFKSFNHGQTKFKITKWDAVYNPSISSQRPWMICKIFKSFYEKKKKKVSIELARRIPRTPNRSPRYEIDLPALVSVDMDLVAMCYPLFHQATAHPIYACRKEYLNVVQCSAIGCPLPFSVIHYETM
jgi:hypothetical protein